MSKVECNGNICQPCQKRTSLNKDYSKYDLGSDEDVSQEMKKFECSGCELRPG